MSQKAKLTLVFLTINLLSTIYSQLLDNADLRFVLSFFNNGIRAPAQTAMTNEDKTIDLFNENWSIPGPSELTNIGTRQQYLLGKRNRGIYGNFVSDTYDPNEVYIRVADYNNTLMSAQAQMSGFYPDGNGYTVPSSLLDVAKPPGTNNNYGNIDAISSTTGGQTTYFSLPNRMQIVPTHVFEADDRKYFLLYGIKDACPELYETIYDDNVESKEIKDMIDEFNNRYSEKLVKVFSVDKDYFRNIDNLYLFLDTYEIDYVHGRDLSIITNAGINKESFYNDTIKYLNVIKYDFYNGGEDMYYPKIAFSSFADELFKWTDNRINKDKNNNMKYQSYSMPKIVFFGVKDSTLASLYLYIKDAMNITDTVDHNIPYSSSLNIELYRKIGSTNENDYQVRINFNDRIYGPFNYTTFKNDMMTNYMTLHEIDDYCDGYNFLVGWGFRNATIVLGVLLGALLLAFLALLLCCCLCYERKNKNDHHKVNNTVPHDEKQV